MEVWRTFCSRTTTSVTVELRRLQLNACLLVLRDEQQFGVVGPLDLVEDVARLVMISSFEGLDEVWLKTKRCNVEVLKVSSFEAELLRVTALVAVPCSRMFGWHMLKMLI